MSVLLIDETDCVQRMIAPLAWLTGETVLSATDLGSALRAIETYEPTAVISGLPLTNDQGMTLLLYVSARHPGMPVVVLVDDLTDDLAQQAQWYGARGTLAKSGDPRVLPSGLGPLLGLPTPAIEQDPYTAILAAASRRHVDTPVQIDLAAAVSGLFRGLGEVSGHRATLALAEDGTLLTSLASARGGDLHGAAAEIQGVIAARHQACPTPTLAERGDAEFRADHGSVIITCCGETAQHAHIATVLADGGNRSLVELAHARLRRALRGAASATR